MITKNRMKELEYFVKQYDEWKEEIRHVRLIFGSNEWLDPTGDEAVRIYELEQAIGLIDICMSSVDEYLRPYMLEHLTKGATYEYLRTKKGMIFGRRQFYEERTRFFLKLSQEKHIL